MKVTKLLTAAALMAAITFTACKGKGPKDYIVNKWKMTSVSGGEADQMPDSLKKVMMAAFSMEFMKDNKYKVSNGPGMEEIGTYKLSDDGKSLSTTEDGKSKTETIGIDEISKSKMTLSKEGMKMVLETK